MQANRASSKRRPSTAIPTGRFLTSRDESRRMRFCRRDSITRAGDLSTPSGFGR
jgi:hypothetical protein